MKDCHTVLVSFFFLAVLGGSLLLLRLFSSGGEQASRCNGFLLGSTGSWVLGLQ